MGKKFSDVWFMRSQIRVALRGLDPRIHVFAGAARIGATLALVCALLLAACAEGAGASDNDKRGGFYGGVSGGMSRP